MSTDLHWEATGTGPPVLLLHSGLTDSRGWRPTVPALAEGFRVIVYDARGYGRSPDPVGPWNPLDDLQSVMEAAGVQRAHLVGNSLGAGVSRLASVARPQLVLSLTLVGAGLAGLEPPADNKQGQKRFEQDMEAGKRFRDALEVGDVEGALGAARGLWLEGPEQAAMAAEVLARPRTIQPVVADQGRPPEEVSVPTLVLVGDRDASVMGLAAKELARRIPGARLEVIAGARHHPQLDRPEEFNRLVGGFLSSIDA